MTRNLDGDCWFQTIKGNPFYLFDPWPEDFDIDEIAHSLAIQNRFNGHTHYPESVALHSVLVAELLKKWDEPIEVVRCGLLHDAAEAYVGDVISPLKRKLTDYKPIEANIEEAIAKRFGLPYPFPESVKLADKAMLLVERRALLAEPPRPWVEDTGLDVPKWGIAELTWQEAKELFLSTFWRLYR